MRPEAVYEGWEWWLECPHCTEGFAVEYDPTGNDVTCLACGKRSHVGGRNDNDLPEAIDNGERHRFRCPSCDDLSWTEYDPRGDDDSCQSCGADVLVSS